MAQAEASPAPFLSAPPAGFVEATAAVSRLPPAELEGIALQVTRFVLQRNGSLSLADLAERTAPTMEEREKGALRTAALDAARQAVSALTYIYRDAARSETSPEMLGAALSAASNLSPESCACITKVYRAKYQLLVGPDRVQAVLSMGKLLAMDWKLSVATQSSHCAKINAPVVILRFRVADNCGQVTSHSAELTVAEFEDFAGKVSEMSAVMETL